MLMLHPSALDYAILGIYFVVVLGIGFVARLSIKTDLDFFLSGRSLPAWITGLAFIAANLGALEILGQAANGAQYGVAAVHYYWIGAVPAMVFLGLVMMPFYYGSKVRSVPEYLRLRFNEATHAFNAITFAIATVLISGVNLFALALIVHLFSIFNAPLFATFIIAMFWRRATAWGGFWSLVAGTAAAYAVNRLNAYHAIFHFGSALSASFWQAIIAFIVDAVVLVAVSLFTRPTTQESLRGLVWGLTQEAELEANPDPRDQLWWRSPIPLGGVAIAPLIVLNIVLI
jgi:Na+/proline symporter